MPHFRRKLKCPGTEGWRGSGVWAIPKKCAETIRAKQ